MRTTVIPAQITTVEDKIAGNFNFTQILLMLGALFTVTFIYAAMPPTLHFSVYKIPFIVIATLCFFTLSLRVKGRVVLNWLLLLARYRFRPRYYVFDKNELYLREDLMIETRLEKKVKTKKVKNEAKLKNLAVEDLIMLEQFLKNPKIGLSFRFSKKGIMNVVATQQAKH